MKKNAFKRITAGILLSVTFLSSNVYASSWSRSGNNWNLLNDQGSKLTGWQLAGGKWYYLDDNGNMITNWKNINGEWYYLNPNGDMAIGWKNINGIWYYFQPSGAMKVGHLKYNNNWYYLNKDGSMAHNSSFNGLIFDASGILVNYYDSGDVSSFKSKIDQITLEDPVPANFYIKDDINYGDIITNKSLKEIYDIYTKFTGSLNASTYKQSVESVKPYLSDEVYKQLSEQTNIPNTNSTRWINYVVNCFDNITYKDNKYEGVYFKITDNNDFTLTFIVINTGNKYEVIYTKYGY